MTVAPTFPFTSPRSVEAFAVDDRSAQIVWRGLGAGTVVARIDDRMVPLGDGRRPGAAWLTDLMPGRDHRIVVSVDDRPVGTLRAHTEPCLGAGPTAKIATIGDIHLGEQGFGLVKRMNEPRTSQPYPLRCALAAIDEALDWGAELIVIKGDITDDGRAEQWAQLDLLLERTTVPVMAIPGNHDVIGKHHSLDATEQLRSRGLFPSPVQILDDATARVVVFDSTVAGHGFGRFGPLADELEAAVDVDRPVLLFTHHHLQTTTLPRFWPIGATRLDGYGTLDRLLDVNPDIFISSGHSHRSRVRHHRSAVVTEVGSVKDHPGVWGSYELTGTGIRQVGRRVERPDCIGWTERTHAVAGGVWGMWSPGGIDDRCVTHEWTRPRPVKISEDQRSPRRSRTRSTSAAS
jgi:predicted phosphodiesterase